MTQAQETLLRKMYFNADEITRCEMEEAYPDLFQSLYEFDKSFTVDISYGKDGKNPLVICFGLAPSKSFQKKCLMVNSFYKAEIFEFDGHQFIKFIKKN